MKKIKRFSTLHKRVVQDKKPIWVCISGETTGGFSIGFMSKLFDAGLVGIPTKQEEKFYPTDKEEV